MRKLTVVIAAAVAALAATGCRHTESRPAAEDVTLPPEPVQSPAGVDASGSPLAEGGAVAGGGAVQRTCVADSDCAAGERCEARACVATAGECDSLPALYFDFDQAELSFEATEAAVHLARCLRDHGVGSATVEAFADERGSAEYNLALSYRRGEAVRKTLAGAGLAVPLKVVGWGEAFPAATGSGEEAWKKNRRAIVTPAGAPLVDGRAHAER